MSKVDRKKPTCTRRRLVERRSRVKTTFGLSTPHHSGTRATRQAQKGSLYYGTSPNHEAAPRHPLIDIQSPEFAEQYDLGITWRLYGDEQSSGPVPASYLVTNLQRYAEYGYFGSNDPYHLFHLGFFLGMYHGGILSTQTGQRRLDVTTLAHLDHRDARRGYRAGREYYFVDAEPHEQRYTEASLIARLGESVTEMATCRDSESTWFFCVGCLLGELSGPLFPMIEAEQRVYLPQRQRLEHARRQHRIVQA